jgi:hypothetical protein
MKLQEKADDLIAGGKKIIVVDMESALDFTDMSSDMLHPNEKGFSKMADIWFNKIQELLITKPFYPENYSAVLNKNIIFSWNSVPFTDQYRLQVARDNNFFKIFYDSTVTDTFAVINSIEANNEFFWRVQRRINNNYGPFSEIRSFSTFNLVSADDEINNPFEYSLLQNYPDPFNPSTTIEFSIPEKTRVILTIFDILGNKLSELINEEKNPGKYSVQFNAGNIEENNLSSGVYIYNLKTNSFSKSRKMILLK